MTRSSAPDHSLDGDSSESNSRMNALTEILQSHPFQRFQINEHDVTVWDRIGPYTLTFDMVFSLGIKTRC